MVQRIVIHIRHKNTYREVIKTQLTSEGGIQCQPKEPDDRRDNEGSQKNVRELLFSGVALYRGYRKACSDQYLALRFYIKQTYCGSTVRMNSPTS
jgi:hypothetical protein